MQQQISYYKIERPAPQQYPVSMSLNLNIRELRKAKGMTIQELAGKIGVSIPHLSEVERGKKNLNNHLMERLAKHLNVDPAALVSAADRSDLAAFYEKAKKLSPEDQVRVDQFVDALLVSGGGTTQKQ